MSAIVYGKHVIAEFFVRIGKIIRIHARFHSAGNNNYGFFVTEIEILADESEFSAFNRNSFVILFAFFAPLLSESEHLLLFLVFPTAISRPLFLARADE